MPNGSYSAEAVLKILDGPGQRGIDRCALEPLHDEIGSVFIAARLSCFAGPTTWRLALEKTEFDLRLGPLALHTSVYTYSDQTIENHFNLPAARTPLLDHPGNRGAFNDEGEIAETCRRVYLRGLPVTVPSNPADYVRAGIKSHSELDPPVRATEFDVFRYLATYYYDLLFLSPQELASHTQEDEVLILHLTDWYHPRSPWAYPSDTACWRSIAQAIATSDPLQYSPSRVSNSSWRSYI